MTTLTADSQPTNPILRAIYRPPYIGLMAFMAVLLVIPLGHALMVLTEHLFGAEHRYTAAFVMGVFGIYILWVGVRRRQEAIGTWLGFFSGALLWTSWVEFAFMFYGRILYGLPVQIENDLVIRLPEYMMMTTSVGVMLTAFFFFFFNKDTRCHFFLWFHRHLHMDMGERSSGRERNFATITFMETVFITWFFYIYQLTVYDPAMIGAYHPIAYATFLVYFVWGVYLFIRLIKYRRVSSAVRYAIPTAIILWGDVEFMSRWRLFTEVWLHPERYILECSLILVGCIAVTALTMLSPKKRSEVEA